LFLFGGYQSGFAATSLSKETVEIIDFRTEFKLFWEKAKGKSLSDQRKIWDQLIEAPHQKLFDGAVWEKQIRPEWFKIKDIALSARLKQYPDLYEPTLRNFDVLPQIIRDQVGRLKKVVTDLQVSFPIYLVVAPNFDAKSALISNNSESVAVLLAADSLALEKANFDVLLPHELFHAFHAIKAGYKNDGVMPNVSLWIPLWEEGLATYISGLANPDVQDSELLLDSHFQTISKNDLEWLSNEFLKQKDLKVLNQGPTEEFRKWFSSGRLKVREDLPNRCGYYLGLQVARRLSKKYTLDQMIGWTPDVAKNYVVSALKELSK
jgi:hypothetical protein